MIQEKGGVRMRRGDERHTSGFTFLYYFMGKKRSVQAPMRSVMMSACLQVESL